MKSQRQYRFARSKISVTVMVAIAVAMGGCKQGANVADTQANADLPLQVPVTVVQAREWQATISGFGRVVAAEKVEIGVEVGGTIKALLFREGERVNAGQVLLQLDDRKQRLRLQRARADVASLRAELDAARGTYQRYQALIERQVISQEAFKQKQAEAGSASARLAEAIAARALVLQELQDLTVVSPASGVVAVEAIEEGQRVRPGDVLAVLHSGASLQVVTHVREEEVNLLQIGDSAPIRSPGAPGHEYIGAVESIASAADPITGNFAVKLRVDNSNGFLREGMSARVSLRSSRTQTVVSIPRSALTDRDRQRVLFVVQDGVAKRVHPQLGFGDDDKVIVHAGLRSGDQLITGRLQLLVDDTPVQPVSNAAFLARASF